MFDDTADVVQSSVRQARVAVTREGINAVFPNGLVNVHARAIVAYHWFWHEGCGFTVGIGHVKHHVFQNLRPVRALNQRREFRTDFVLALTRHFVVVHFHRHTHLFEQQAHFRAHVLELIGRRHREITAFDARTMTQIAAFGFH